MWLSDSHSAFLFFPVPNPFSLVIPIDIIISSSLFLPATHPILAQPTPAHSAKVCPPGQDCTLAFEGKGGILTISQKGPERLSDLHQVTQQNA